MPIPSEIQTIIDQIATHLAAQGQPSMASYQCLYRGPDGLKCAIGALLSDEACEGLGNTTVAAILNGGYTLAFEELEALRGTVDEGDFAEFLYRCQCYHDAPNARFGATYIDRIMVGTATVDVIRADLTSLWTW